MNRMVCVRTFAAAIMVAGLGVTAASSQARAQNSNASSITSNRVAVTADVLDRFAAGLKAELAERDRLAASATTDPNVRVLLRRRDLQLRCDSLKKAAQAEIEDVMKKIPTATTEAQSNALIQRMTKAQMRSGAPCELGPEPATEQSFFDNLRTAEAGLDAIGARAAGMSPAQYAYVRERVAAAVITLHTGGTAHGYSAADLAAIRGRVNVLWPLVVRDFKYDGARKQSYEY